MGNRSEKFHLNHHRGLLAQVAVFFAAFLYVLIDGFALNPYRALEAMPWFLYPGAALVLAAVVIPAGRKAPTLERVVVAVITIGAATAATHPLALRVNAATGTVEQVRYTWVGEGRFETEEGDYPPVTVDTDRVPDYWKKNRRDRHAPVHHRPRRRRHPPAGYPAAGPPPAHIPSILRNREPDGVVTPTSSVPENPGDNEREGLYSIRSVKGQIVRSGHALQTGRGRQISLPS